MSRYQGGHNAGHRVYVGDKAFVLRLLPSGIINPDATWTEDQIKDLVALLLDPESPVNK